MDMTTFRLRRAAAVTKRVGQQEWTTPGTYEFVVPMSVFSMSAVLIGGAQGGSSDDGTYGGNGGSAGQLRYINSFPVTPGETLTIEVGVGGAFNQNDAPQNKPGGITVIRRGSNVICRAASGSSNTGTPFGAGPFGGTVGGGNGGVGGFSLTSAGGGGGGAGGYSGDGGIGHRAGSTTASAGQGGGGGGGAANLDGGGVGIYGQGANGSANGGPGSGGSGKLFGGGGGGSSTAQGALGNSGGAGACRIIWGAGRAYPSTRTADEFP